MKLYKCLIVFVLLSILYVPTIFAESSGNEFGFEFSQITYKEPGLMEEKGTMSGLFFSFASYDKLMLKLEGKYSSGSVDYTGAYLDGTPVSVDNIKDYGYESRILVGGKKSPIRETTTALYIYTGFGYRYLNDDMSKFLGGYERESNYYYMPIGIEIIPAVKNDWSVGATLEYDVFRQGKQISHLSDLDPGLNDVTNAQKHGYGYRASIKLQSPDQKTVIALFTKYWNIKKSENKTIYYDGDAYVLYEPKNNSNEIGITVGWKF
ncbi:MAG: hypothetical protein V1871_03085 [Planctomycetota bacterium]